VVDVVEDVFVNEVNLRIHFGFINRRTFLGTNKENQQPQDNQQNNSEEGKTEESNANGDVPQPQRQQSKTTVAEQVNQSSTTGDSRPQ
jgi:hypothetical protein